MKKPHFFCEACGAETPRDAKRCPACGRYFSSVRCPACGFTGEEDLFREGCPVCGYYAPVPPARESREKPAAAGALPPWVYILSAAALAVVLAGLLFILK